MTDLPDINVWLALVYSGHVHHPAAKTWFEAVSERGAGFCRVTQLGLLRLITNEKIMGDEVLSQRQAWNIYDALCRDVRIAFWPESTGLENHWRALSSSMLPATRLWTDAYLAAFASAREARMVTFDRGFAKFARVDVLILKG